MEKQTALEWLENQVNNMIKNGGDLGDDYPALLKHIEQAKKIDAVIISDAYDAGFVAGQNFEASNKFDFADGIEYYLENFNSEHLENK